MDAPLPLEEVPPLALSEVMRDVDLFVGVASIGNDPGWSDGGADAEHPSQWRGTTARAYWQRYSAAALEVAGESRKQLLSDSSRCPSSRATKPKPSRPALVMDWQECIGMRY